MSDRPTPHVLPVDADVWPRRPVAGVDQWPGPYTSVILDVRTGQLTGHARDWLWEQETGVSRTDHCDATLYGDFPGSWSTVPDQLRWVVHRENLPADEFNDLLAQLAGPVAELLAGLENLPGTTELAWTARAVLAADRIVAALTASQPVDGQPPRAVLDFGDVVKAVPELVKPEWALYSDAQLDQEVQALYESLLLRQPGVLERLGISGANLRLVNELAGIRLWLYRYRADHAGQLLEVDADEWLDQYGQKLLGECTSESTPAELHQLGRTATAVAARNGYRLLDVDRVLHERREQARDRVRGRLAGAGRDVKAAEQRLAAARKVQQNLLARIFRWGDPRDTDADLARRTGTSKQAVNGFRHRWRSGR